MLESWGAKVQDLVFLSDDKNLTSYRGKDVVYAVFTEGLVPDPYTKERRKEREKPKEIGVQDIVADIDTLGKDLDRTKFFGGLRYLRKRYPNKTWYIIFDDDTYVSSALSVAAFAAFAAATCAAFAAAAAATAAAHRTMLAV